MGVDGKLDIRSDGIADLAQRPRTHHERSQLGAIAPRQRRPLAQREDVAAAHQIAAHFANAGVPSLLLDVTADAAAQGLKRARGLKPDPFFLPDGWTLITTASFDDGMARRWWV